MPRDSAGNYQLPAGNPVASGTIISTTWANPTMSDIGTELTNSLDRNGRGGMLAPFKFADGTIVAPSITFTSEPGSGIYRALTNDIRFGIVGRDTTRWINASAVTIGEQVPFEIWDGAAWRPVMYQGGALSGILPNDTFLQGVDFAGTGVVDIVKVNVSDQIEFGSGVEVITSGDVFLQKVDASLVVGGTELGGQLGYGSLGLNGATNGGLLQFYIAGVIKAQILNDADSLLIHNAAALTTIEFDASNNVTIPNGNLTVSAGSLVIANTGDAYVQYTVTAATNWCAGIDDSDGDAWVVCRAAAPNGTNALHIDQSNNVTIPNGSLGVGAAPSDLFQVQVGTTGSARIGVPKDGGGGFKLYSTWTGGLETATIDFDLESGAGGSERASINLYTMNAGAVVLNTQFNADGSVTIPNGVLGVGIAPLAAQVLSVHTGANINVGIQLGVSYPTGSLIQGINDAANALTPLEFRALDFHFLANGIEKLTLGTNVTIPNGGLLVATTTGITTGSTGSELNAIGQIKIGLPAGGEVTNYFTSVGKAGFISLAGQVATYNSVSDYRLKENVVPLEDALTLVAQLKPSRFNFITTPDVILDGFIAHEVQEVVAQAVAGEKDGVNMQGLDKSHLVPLLTAAIQEITSRLELLEE